MYFVADHESAVWTVRTESGGPRCRSTSYGGSPSYLVWRKCRRVDRLTDHLSVSDRTRSNSCSVRLQGRRGFELGRSERTRPRSATVGIFSACPSSVSRCLYAQVIVGMSLSISQWRLPNKDSVGINVGIYFDVLRRLLDCVGSQKVLSFADGRHEPGS